MPVNEIIHEVWGSNLNKQEKVEKVQVRGHYEKKIVDGFFGKKEENVFVDTYYIDATDEDEARRFFSHKCGLLSLFLTYVQGRPRFIVFLDGHVGSEFVAHEMEFRFDKEKLGINNGKPIVEICFYGIGKRRGPFSSYSTSSIIFTFADQDQMDQYFKSNSAPVRMPKSLEYKGSRYNNIGGGTYKSDTGDILPHLLLMYLMLEAGERQSFIDHNPEVPALLADASMGLDAVDRNIQNSYGGVFDGGGASADFGGSVDSGLDSGCCDAGSSSSGCDGGSCGE